LEKPFFHVVGMKILSLALVFAGAFDLHKHNGANVAQAALIRT
jgi:hypothetical protein